MMKEETHRDGIHEWFGLSYASWLTIPRVVLQSMPDEWQYEFVRLLEQIPEAIGDWEGNANFFVQTKDVAGRYILTNLSDYQRGRRTLPIKEGYSYVSPKSLYREALKEAIRYCKGYRYALEQCGENYAEGEIRDFIESASALLKGGEE